MIFVDILKKAGKNFLAFVLGGLVGIILSIIYTIKLWVPSHAPSVGLGIIALLPAMLILFGILGLVIGGFCGIIIYQVIKRVRRNN